MNRVQYRCRLSGSDLPQTYEALPFQAMSQYYDDQDHYAVLGVSPNANEREIRKQYLKLSLEHHPDKNLDDPQAAQAAFICIGQAYQVLSDPVKRAEYDKIYRLRGFHSAAPKQQRPNTGNGGSGFATGFTGSGNTDSSGYNAYATNQNTRPQQQQQQQQQQYASYKEAFEATMADLSEDELRDVTGAAATLGGIVGAILGSRLFKDHHPLLRDVGTSVASAMASQAAASVVKTAHTRSVQKAMAIQEQRERVARGEPIIEDKKPDQSIGKHLQEIILEVVQNSAKEVGNSIQQAADNMMANNRKNKSAGRQ
jgi:curved DNA-binding protein CbpA